MGNSKIVRKGLSKYDFTAAGESTNRAGGREGENLQKQKVKMQKITPGDTKIRVFKKKMQDKINKNHFLAGQTMVYPL